MKRTKKAVIDKDMAGVEIALRRAAKQAGKIPIQTNTPLVPWSGPVVPLVPGPGRWSLVPGRTKLFR